MSGSMTQKIEKDKKMKITKDDVEYIAHLSRLEVDDALTEKFADQISRTLKYIDKLKDVDVSGVLPASNIVFTTNVLREDVEKGSSGPEVTLSNAPERDDDFYTVPRVVG